MRSLAAVAAGLAAALTVPPYLHAQQRPAITGVAFVRLYTSDTPASDAFYRMIGLAPEPSNGAGGDSVRRYDVSNSQWIEILPLPEPAPQSRLAAVGLTTRDAAGLEKYLRARGVTIVKPLHDGEFSVLDPESNRIVFVQAGSHPATAPGTAAVGEPTSQRIIHAGFVVKDPAAEDKFYKDILGFHDYWHGGMRDSQTDWMSLQVPDGSDWVEYMLHIHLPSEARGAQQELGIQDHFALGVDHMQSAEDALARNGCAATPQGGNCKKPQMGKDGKVQMNVYDPDMTRVEYMEFAPSGAVCCSSIKGRQPTNIEDK